MCSNKRCCRKSRYGQVIGHHFKMIDAEYKNIQSDDRETHRTTQSNAITFSIQRQEFDRQPIQMTC